MTERKFFKLNDDFTVSLVDRADYIEYLAHKPYEHHRIALTEIATRLTVSTVFIGHDGSLFETVVFVNDKTMEQRRYETYEDAVLGHHELVDKIKTYRACRAL
jgi:hypothetical protein